jgi:energy-coupling factor transporter ATP-binding protein EcfA2
VALAAVAVRRPELWLLDEPHAGLDASGRDMLDALLRRAVERGATVMVASHELERVRGLATRVVSVTSGAVAGLAGEHGGAPGTAPERAARAAGTGPVDVA